MPKITGVKEVKAQLLALAAKAPKDVSVVVGYNAAYALWVHEAVEMKLRGLPRGTKGFYWDPQGQAQAKFLETPARMYRDRIAKIAVDTYRKNGGDLAQALYFAGLYLQRESQKLVPVDTGNLKGSAFTELE